MNTWTQECFHGVAALVVAHVFLIVEALGANVFLLALVAHCQAGPSQCVVVIITLVESPPVVVPLQAVNTVHEPGVCSSQWFQVSIREQRHHILHAPPAPESGTLRRM